MVYPSKFCSDYWSASETPNFGRRVRNDMREVHHCGVSTEYHLRRLTVSLNLNDKKAVVAEVSAKVAKAQTIVVAEYRGIQDRKSVV